LDEIREREIQCARTFAEATGSTQKAYQFAVAEFVASCSYERTCEFYAPRANARDHELHLSLSEGIFPQNLSSLIGKGLSSATDGGLLRLWSGGGDRASGPTIRRAVPTVNVTREVTLMEVSESTLACDHCGGEVRAGDDFCTNCGTLLRRGATCAAHRSVQAEGACVICGDPFCGDCGGWADRTFFCAAHAKYEVVDGMARIFRSRDSSLAYLASTSLEGAGFHPLLVGRSLPARAALSHGVSTGEPLAILVPFTEVLSAEKYLAGEGMDSA